jgi:hypothetical protein
MITARDAMPSGMKSERSCYVLEFFPWSISMNDLEMSTKMFIFMNVVWKHNFATRFLLTSAADVSRESLLSTRKNVPGTS